MAEPIEISFWVVDWGGPKESDIGRKCMGRGNFEERGGPL